MTECDGTASPSVDTVFDVLANEHRRELLFDLLEYAPGDGADTRTSEGLDLDAVEREDLELLIRHTHLPKLEDTGFVDWDRDADVVQEGPRFGDVRPLLELLVEYADEDSTEGR